MAGTVLNLSIDAGMDYFLETCYVDYTTNLPKNTQNFSALLEVRSDWTNPLPYLSLSSDNGRILMGGTNGSIIIRFAPEDTNPNLQPLAWTRGVYDLIVTDQNGIRTKLMKGFVNIIGTISVDYQPLIINDYLAPNQLTGSVGTFWANIT